jgi:hypothetical protein
MRSVSQWLAPALALLFVVGLGTDAFAQQPVPEISPAAIPAGLALLAGGVLMLRATRRRK